MARHGQNEDNAAGILNGHRDLPLTAQGVAQAEEAAAQLAASGLRFDHIYTSPLSRARQTAEIIAEALGADRPVELAELIERDFGVMTGRDQSRIEELCGPDIIKTDTVTYFLDPEGAETFPDLLVRARQLLRRLQNIHSDGTILLVTHGDFGKMIYASYYHLDWQDVLTKFHFGNSELLLLAEDSSADESHIVKISQYNP